MRQLRAPGNTCLSAVRAGVTGTVMHAINPSKGCGAVMRTAPIGLIEGVIRLAIFLGYVIAISRMEDIKRTYMYHGAEHKTINAFESSSVPIVTPNAV